MNSFHSYKWETAGALGAFLAVVAGTNPGGCVLPGAANAAGFLGFTTDSLTAAQQGQAASVARGRCRAIAAGAITHGHWVNIAGTTGKVQDCQTAVDAAPGTPANTYVIGKAETDAAADGDQIIVTTIEFVAKTATS